MSLLELFDRSHVETFDTDVPRHEVRIPSGYQRQVTWLPQINDIFPNFSASSTQGRIDFHDWAEGHWVLMLSHPSIKSAVSATEWAGIASLKTEFDALGIKVLGICGDSAVDHARWETQLGTQFGLQFDFPTVEDREGKLARAFGMIHPKQGQDFAIRKTFIIDPSLRVKMSMEYPVNVGRSIDEILRAVAALQVTEEHRVGMPADWDVGQECLVAPYLSDARAREAYGEVRMVSPTLRVIPCPQGKATYRSAPPPPQTIAETYGQR